MDIEELDKKASKILDAARVREKCLKAHICPECGEFMKDALPELRVDASKLRKWFHNFLNNILKSSGDDLPWYDLFCNKCNKTFTIWI